jgi:O-antigen ligase
MAPLRGRAVRALPWALGGIALSVGAGVLLAADPVVPLDVGLALAVAVAVAIRPYEALLVVVAIHVIAPSQLFWTSLTLAGVGLAVLVRAPGAVPRKIALPLLLLLLVTLPAVPVHPSADEGTGPAILTMPLLHVRWSDAVSIELASWIGVGSVLATIGLAAWAVTTRERFNFLVTAVLLGSLYPIGYALKQYAAGDLTVRTGQSDSFAAVRGPFDHPNYLAFYLVVVIGIALVAFLESRRLAVRLALAAFLVAASASLLLTYTRSAWIGLAIAVLLVGVFRYRVLLVGGVMLLALAAFALPGEARKVQDRFGDLSNSSQSHASNSWDWRTGQWGRMEHWGWQRPVLGQGFASYPRLSIKEFGLLDPHYGVVDPDHPGAPRGIAPHNDYVKMFVETGLVGLALWTLTLIGLAVTAARARAAPGLAGYATGMLAIMLALVVISVADNVQSYTTVLLVAGAVIGGLAGAQRAQARNRTS